eukprot:gi/632983337/ref/XP_007908597.1/ PREDICTED: RNA-binding protein Musashi homolog 1 [Callorhinchus milii]
MRSSSAGLPLPSLPPLLLSSPSASDEPRCPLCSPPLPVPVPVPVLAGPLPGWDWDWDWVWDWKVMEADANQANSVLSADSQHDPCKMFVGGLSWQTTQEGLKEYFCKFGDVKECMVMRDPVTKRSRGFGFVTFVDQTGVDKVLAQPRHELDSKTIDPKVAFPRRAQPKMVTRTKKIFVGGLSVNTTVEDVKQYFDQFGKVDDAMLMFDKTTNRHRGYPGFQAASYASRGYTGLAPGYTYQFPGPFLLPPTATLPSSAGRAAQSALQTSQWPPSVLLQDWPTGAIPLTAYGPMAAAAAAAVVRGTGSTPTRTGGFLGTTSPAPMADLYGTANQDSGVSSYISAASPAPSTGFGHSLGGPVYQPEEGAQSMWLDLRTTS